MKKLSLNALEEISGKKFFGWTDWDCGPVEWTGPSTCSRTCTRTRHFLFIRTETDKKVDSGFCIDAVS